MDIWDPAFASFYKEMYSRDMPTGHGQMGPYQLVRALWLVNLAGRTLVYVPLKFEVGFVAKLFRYLSLSVLNFHSQWKLKTFLYSNKLGFVLVYRYLCLAIEHCWVFCIGSCEPVHEDRTLNCVMKRTNDLKTLSNWLVLLSRCVKNLKHFQVRVSKNRFRARQGHSRF